VGGKSVAQGERGGLNWLGLFYQYGYRCEKITQRAKENFLVAAELGDVEAMVGVGEFFDKDDPQRFALFGRAAAKGNFFYFVIQMVDQIRNFSNETGHAKVVFAIGRALKGQIDNEKGTIFGMAYKFDDTFIGPPIRLFMFTNFKCNRIEKQSTAGQLLD
jgi:hypothetical protein